MPQKDTGWKTETNRERKTAEKKVTFTQDYNKKRPDHGSEQWKRAQDFQRRNQNFIDDRFRRSSPTAYQSFSPRPNFAYGNNYPNSGSLYDQRPNHSFHRNDGNRSRNGSFNSQNGNWRNNGIFSRSPATQRRDFSQHTSYRRSRGDQPDNSALRRSDNRPKTGFTPYEQWFPQNNNQTSSNVLHFTTTDETINELSDLSPLNC